MRVFICKKRNSFWILSVFRIAPTMYIPLMTLANSTNHAARQLKIQSIRDKVILELVAFPHPISNPSSLKRWLGPPATCEKRMEWRRTDLAFCAILSPTICGSPLFCAWTLRCLPAESFQPFPLCLFLRQSAISPRSRRWVLYAFLDSNQPLI